MCHNVWVHRAQPACSAGKYLQTEGAPQKCAGSVAWPKLSSSPRAPCCIAFSVSQCSVPATVPAFMNEIKN